MKRTPLVVSLSLLAAACGGKSASTTPATVDPAAAPTETGTLNSVATGEYLSCELDGGVARCWGELGDNTGSSQALAPTVSSGDLQLTQLSAYGRTACGVTGDGAGYCWGPNTDGQLGNGKTDAGSKTPSVVAGKLSFKMIAAGDPTSCGITTAGAAYCWGENGFGQVGNGVASTDDVLVPTAVAGDHVFATVSVSGTFACGVTTDGAAYCWGANNAGQLGTGKPISSQTTDLSNVPSKVVGDQTWSTVTTGQSFACGVTTTGAAMCWGKNDYRLGNGREDDSSTPVAVSGNHAFVQLDAGKNHVCGITRSGSAVCWGANGAGQLGNGPGDPADLSRAPIAAAGGLAFAAISASDGEHTCAIASDHASTYCWGRNDRGQLGNGSATGSNTTRSPAPTRVTIAR